MARETKQCMIQKSEQVIEEVKGTMTTERDMFWTVHRGLYFINRALWAIREVEAAEDDMDKLLEIQDRYDMIFSYKVEGE